MNYILKFFKEAYSSNKKLIIINLLLTTSYKILIILLPVAVGNAFDILNKVKSLMSNSISLDFSIAIGTIILLLLLIIFVSPFQAKVQSELVNNIILQKSIDWFNTLFSKDFRFFINKNAARNANIVERALQAHEKLLNHLFEVILPVIIEILISIFVLSKIVGFYFIPYLIIMILFQLKFTLKLINERRHHISELNEIEDESAEIIIEVLSKGLLYKTYNKVNLALNRLEKVFREYANKNILISKSGSKLNLVPFSFQTFSQIFGLILSFILIQKNLISIGQAVAILAIMNRFSISVSESVGAFRVLDQFNIDIKELLSLLSEPSIFRISKIFNSYSELSNPENLNIKELNLKPFEYSKSEFTIFSDKSFKFEIGDRVVMTGPSGNGKSTLLELCAGLDQKSREIVCLDPNKSLQDFSNEEHLSLVIFSPQDPLIITGNIYDNLLIEEIKLSPSEKEKIHTLLRELSLEHLISRSTELLNTEKISGGEAKRISIARSLMRSAKVYLFDEPTAGLNEELQKKVWDCIFTYTKDSILICTTHDSSIISEFSRKVTVLKGAVE